MSKFKLSKRSIKNLQDVHPELRELVEYAISVTLVDFGVIEGLRTRERQVELVRSGASQTMHSKHLTGHAVDLMAYVAGRGCWELQPYYEIASAMKIAAQVIGVKNLRWGGAWHIDDISEFDGTMEEAQNDYINHKRLMGRRVFIDSPHFELNPE